METCVPLRRKIVPDERGILQQEARLLSFRYYISLLASLSCGERCDGVQVLHTSIWKTTQERKGQASRQIGVRWPFGVSHMTAMSMQYGSTTGGGALCVNSSLDDTSQYRLLCYYALWLLWLLIRDEAHGDLRSGMREVARV